MRYEVVLKTTGQPPTDADQLIVDQDGMVCWWDESAGWVYDPHQDDYLVRVLES